MVLKDTRGAHRRFSLIDEVYIAYIKMRPQKEEGFQSLNIYISSSVLLDSEKVLLGIHQDAGRDVQYSYKFNLTIPMRSDPGW